MLRRLLFAAALGYPVLASAFLGFNFRSCDENKAETTPTARFEMDDVTGTVYDTKTKLTWWRCAEGQHFSAGRCEGKPGWWSLESAKRQFMVDGEGWRLPTKDELSSINEGKCIRPSINLTVFPDTPAKSYYWSSTLVSNYGDTAWSLDLVEGKLIAYDMGDELNIRLVKGGEVAEKWRAEAQAAAQRAKEDEVHQGQEEVRRRMEREAKELEERRRRLEEAESEKRAQVAFEEAKNKAVFSCRDAAECGKVFSLAQIYISEKSDMKIQVSTDTIVETYTPVDAGKIGMKALKVPGRGTSASIALLVSCKQENLSDMHECRSKSTSIYEGYPEFMQRMFKR